jgi:NAD(P)-dependent dehydrogenase (short-subunit alcohol dehydrogenase family)
MRDALEHLLAGWSPAVPLLLNTDSGDASAIIARARQFASDNAPGLIVTLLTAPPEGLDHLDHHTANAALWAFTQQAALEWAPRGIRVNAIGLGASPAIPFAPNETAGPAPAAPATQADIARTIQAIANWPSMTGQLIRLGA